ncbi:MAG TPA: hypothetical protein VM143_02070 [Acidimicrobiales bacterium]|nr:hypothetical protein [Acidimicrobiales bacterium]
MRRRSLRAMLLALSLVVAACGGGGNGEDTAKSTKTTADGREDTATAKDAPFVAQVASYELVAGQDQRFLAALAGNGTGKIVSFGAVDLEFFYLGTRNDPIDPPQKKFDAPATFFPVAGQHLDPNEHGPREARPSEGIGVYAAEKVNFDEAGYWGVRVNATIDGKAIEASSSFEVVAEPQLPFPGQPAPRTDNPVTGAAGVAPAAIDSRAGDGAPAPDAALHTTSVAAALAAGKPTVVVVSTPVYCVSQFCGPITDSVAALAASYGDKVAFVHLEVWKDFEKKLVNPAAAEWISPRNGVGDTKEPWVFLVGGDGTVKQRFDNVVGDVALEAAVRQLAAG